MKILVLRFSSLGDVALTVPALKSVLNAVPDLECVVATRKPFAPLFAQLPRTELFFLEPKGKHKGLSGLLRFRKELLALHRPDLLIDLHSVLRSQVLRILFRWSGIPSWHFAKQRKLRAERTRKRNKVRTPLASVVEGYLKVFLSAGLSTAPLQGPWLNSSARSERSGRSPIGFAPLASSPQKSWSESGSKELVRKWVDQGRKVWLFGGPDEKEALHRIAQGLDGVEVIPDSSKGLKDDLERISDLEVMVSMDSANMHLAALAGIPTVSIWGATHPDMGFAPLGENHRYVQVDVEELPCRPCSVFGQTPCHRGDLACLGRIDTAQVANTVNELLNGEAHDA